MFYVDQRVIDKSGYSKIKSALSLIFLFAAHGFRASRFDNRQVSWSSIANADDARDSLDAMSNNSITDVEIEFEIRPGRGGSVRAISGAMGGRLTKALIKAGRRLQTARSSAIAPARPFSGDARQRVVVKVSFRNHRHGAGSGRSAVGGGGAGGSLGAHAHYLQRDGASRENARGQFFDKDLDIADDAGVRLQDWAGDPRHFRIMLAPESGARLLEDPSGLMDFTRQTMARMERDLGVGLDWLAVEHHNTDNPHVHVILRGVREDGVELRLPRDYIGHGLRESARGVATELLGERSLADERLKLEREIAAPSLTRLDRAIEAALDSNREVLLQSLGQDHSPAFGDSLRARMQNLERMGLASEVRRNVYRLEQGWTARLEAAKPIDIRRSLSSARLYENSMGRVSGQIVELGPRGENPDRALLVLETPEYGRVLVNTSREAIEDLQKGSLAALEPAGKRPVIDRLAFHPVSQQLSARADTELDRELDRIAKGEPRQLPTLDNVERSLARRAAQHIEQGLGTLDRAGQFAFHPGARERLHELERRDAGRSADQTFYKFRERPLHADREWGGETWKVRGQMELFSGKAAVLTRRTEMEIAPIAKGQSLQIGQDVSLTIGKSPAQHLAQAVQIKPPSLERGLGLGR